MRTAAPRARIGEAMYTRAVEEAADRLVELRREEYGDLTVAVLALGLAVLATQVFPPLALPLFAGGLGVALLGMRALWRRWDLVDRLAGERDAYAISDVRAYAEREATMDRRRTFAAMIREIASAPGSLLEARVGACSEELEALAADLEDETLDLDPVCAVACFRLLSNLVTSPLLNVELPPNELRARLHQIRCGFAPREPGS